MIVENALNIWLINPEQYIKENGCLPITSHAIYEPSSTSFHSEGFFSEQIFGMIGDTKRLVSFGYIDMHTYILQPLIYKNIIKLGSLYENIINGTEYAIFDNTINDFKKCPTPETTIDAGTGYSFFMKYLPKIEFKLTESRAREDRIKDIEKYKKEGNLFTKYLLVLPAGLRDIEEDQQRISQDDINKIYSSALSLGLALSSLENAQSAVFDTVRLNLQKKMVEIYEYIYNIVDGKKGFINGVWAQRKITWGTRNVITGASYQCMTPNDLQVIKPDETKIGVLQAAKGLQPAVVHWVRVAFFDFIFGQRGNNKILLTNKSTLNLEYTEVTDQELAKFNTNEAIGDLISKFKNPHFAKRPVSIRDKNNKEYYLFMVYDTGDEITLFRGMNDFKNVFNRQIKKEYIRPLTWLELFYLSTFSAIHNGIEKTMFNTRYPVIQNESCYPSKIHLVSTTPGRIIKLRSAISGNLRKIYNQYPVLDNPINNSCTIAALRAPGLDADYDGDMTSGNIMMSDTANIENLNYLNSIASVINSQKQLLIGAQTNGIDYFALAVSRPF